MIMKEVSILCSIILKGGANLLEQTCLGILEFPFSFQHKAATEMGNVPQRLMLALSVIFILYNM